MVKNNINDEVITKLSSFHDCLTNELSIIRKSSMSNFYEIPNDLIDGIKFLNNTIFNYAVNNKKITQDSIKIINNLYMKYNRLIFTK